MFFDFHLPSYFFNRPVKDMLPYRFYEEEGKTIIVLNTLGISPDDIVISVESKPASKLIKIKGSTRDDVTKTDYNVNMNFECYSEITNIDWESKNGLTYLYVYYKVIDSEIKINRK